ncbi:metallophosphoesterase family protein [Marinilactibacillus kalidii]|uniref:metallophosphoesterase family protein n=1 Tax=Marinilactibacillus kalidii TaxID=2820274 RepID=UPI001ABEA1C2|nr:metallophosphoesterase [Marinilactibacillus kalidii]
MKLLAVSDNHGDSYLMEEILSIYSEQINVWVHCGDSEFSEQNPLWQSYYTVKGNMDRTNAFPDSRVEQFYDHKLLIAHGHLHNVKSSFEDLKKEAEKVDAQFVFYGHTHIPRVDKVDNIYFINPGSLTQPRGPINKGSYAILDIEGSTGEVNFYDTDHNAIPQLSQKITL